VQLERQLDLLDAAGADELAPLVTEYAAAYGLAQQLARRLKEARAAGRDREREMDLLRFQVDEIASAQLDPGEDVRLAQERERLRHADKLLERVGGALTLLSGEDAGGAGDGLRAAQRRVGEAAVLDGGLQELAARLDGLTVEVEDVALGLRTYLEELDADPARRDALEMRHDKLQALKRKYGATVADVLTYAAEAAEQLSALERYEADEAELVEGVASAQTQALAVAGRLTQARRELAPKFAQRVETELRQLAMPHARFDVTLLSRGEGWEALGPRGAEEAELLFSANPGVPPRPLRATASGGELSRAMLALKSIVTLGDDVETLIFDEVDTGIGGVTATALGERLARLAERTQVICITHLPPVVAFADRHFAITKTSDAEKDLTETVIAEVDGEERVAELCRMLGAGLDDAGARRHAEELLARAREKGRRD
jgi:DNA repair protein RecN (Recombination protein N)